MVDRYLSPKFGVNSFSGMRENYVYGRRTDDDGCPCDDSSSADCAVAQSRSNKQIYWRGNSGVTVLF